LSEEIQPLKTIDVFSKVLGLDNHYFMRYSKRVRNPDVFTYDHSIDYKEDFSLITDSYCDCGCKTAIYVQEEWNGDGYDTEFKTQIEYEKLPNRPKHTKEQVKLQSDIIRTDRKEQELGIIHDQVSCNMIPVSKLVMNESLGTQHSMEIVENE